MRLLWTIMLGATLPLLAADQPLTGTWKLDVSKAKFSQKPEMIELSNGMYKCSTCDPPINVKADGTDQSVSGNPGFDTLNVRIIDDHTTEQIGKKNGKVVFDGKTTVAQDGKSATTEFTSHPPSSDKPVTGKMTVKRVGSSTPGMHAVSGSWVPEKAENFSENGLLVTFEQSAGGLKMTQPTGEHFDAKFDGKEYPYEGSSEGVNKVVVRKIGPRTFEETDKRDENVQATIRMTVSDDRTITMVIHDHQDRQTTLVFVKQ